MTSLIRASFWLTVSELIFNLSGYIIHSVLGRAFGPAEYGRYSIIIAFSTMIVVLIGRGVPIAMSKYLSEVCNSEPNKIPYIKRISARIQFLLIATVTILYFFLAPVFSSLLRDPSLTSLFRISSLIIPAFAAASFYVYYYTGIQKFEKQALLKFFRSIAKILIIISLALLLGTSGAVLGHSIAPFSVFLLAYFSDPFRKIKTKSSEIYNGLSWKKLINFAWPITLFMIFYEIMITVDLYFVKILLSDDKLTGIYSSAITVGRIPFYAFYFLTIILLPKISETTSKGLKDETKKILSSAMRFMFMLLMPSIALLSAFAPSAIRFFYGARYTDGASSLAVLALGAGFLTVFYVLAFVLNGAGNNKVPMWTAFLGCVLNSLLVYLLIPKFGIQGAAIGTTATSFLTMLVLTIYSNYKVARFLYINSLIKYLLVSLAIFFVATNFFAQGRFVFILWSLILLTSYALVLYILGELKRNDLRYFLEAFKRK